MERSLRTVLRWRVWAPFCAALYRLSTRALSRWPLAVLRPPHGRQGARGRRIAYFPHAFPVLSETFIQREVRALRQAGVDVVVVADEARDQPYLDAEARELMEIAHYLAPIDREKLRKARRHWLLRRPLTVLNLFLYVVGRPHASPKSFRNDCELLDRSMHLARVLASLGVTHVHAPWAGPREVAALLAARLLRVPYSVQVRAYDLYAEWSRPGLRERLVHARFIITNSRTNQERIRELLESAPAPSVHRIHNGIELDRFHLREHAATRDGVLQILSVGRLVEQKGFEHLLRACALLRDAGHTVRCRIIGGRTSRQVNYSLELEKLRIALGLESEVLFLGAQPFDRVLAAYTEADLFVLPCVIARDGSRDVTPNAVLEAMAIGLPVISTTVGAIPELVEHDVSGLLVAPGDEDALAEAILRVAADPALRQRLVQNARKRVEDRFDIRKNVQGYAALFRGSNVPEDDAPDHHAP